VTLAAVTLWGTPVAAVSIDERDRYATFQYDPAFAESGVELSPVQMPVREAPYRFAQLPLDAFGGLPGLLADALPDTWGRALVDAWLASQGRVPDSFDIVERLCYIGSRGMGALEFQPSIAPEAATGRDLQVDRLVELAGEALAQRESFVAELTEHPEEAEMRAILTIGTSAGGARPKAIIAFNGATGQVRSGQLDAESGFEQWLLKFDGVTGAGDHGLADPEGWGAVEYAYWRMARAAGVTISDSRLLEEHGRRHFMTRRFDRPPGGDKLHVQTLGALDHISYRMAGVYGYDQAMLLMRRIGIELPEIEQLFRRMVFNVVARNQDDHVKNIAFLMDRAGRWSLAPAYDLTWACDPANTWFRSHQMTINGKRAEITVDDLVAVEKRIGLKRGTAKRVLREVTEAVAIWPQIAEDVAVEPAMAGAIERSLLLTLPPR
jgi:serine/threonine-protein kinase HipA